MGIKTDTKVTGNCIITCMKKKVREDGCFERRKDVVRMLSQQKLPHSLPLSLFLSHMGLHAFYVGYYNVI